MCVITCWAAFLVGNMNILDQPWRVKTSRFGSPRIESLDEDDLEIN